MNRRQHAQGNEREHGASDGMRLDAVRSGMSCLAVLSYEQPVDEKELGADVDESDGEDEAEEKAGKPELAEQEIKPQGDRQVKGESFLFLDEMNACRYTGLIEEAICNRTLYGRPIPDHVHILAAANPYRRRPDTGDEGVRAGFVYKRETQVRINH